MLWCESGVVCERVGCCVLRVGGYVRVSVCLSDVCLCVYVSGCV